MDLDESGWSDAIATHRHATGFQRPVDGGSGIDFNIIARKAKPANARLRAEDPHCGCRERGTAFRPPRPSPFRKH